jgi:spore coat polysaccharide biosynthesis protein SpsF
MTEYLCIVQARMGSKRLPCKVMKPLCGIPIIYHILQRLSQCARLGRIIVATTTNTEDDALCAYLDTIGAAYYRGSAEDVLGRFYDVSRLYPAKAIVRATADNPLVDPKILDATIACFEKTGCRYARTTGFPTGIGAEVFEASLLKEAYEKAVTAYDREHVTPYMQSQAGAGVLASKKDWGHIRLTVDTPEDYARMQKIYSHFYHGAHDFYLEDILAFLEGGVL